MRKDDIEKGINYKHVYEIYKDLFVKLQGIRVVSFYGESSGGCIDDTPCSSLCIP